MEINGCFAYVPKTKNSSILLNRWSCILGQKILSLKLNKPSGYFIPRSWQQQYKYSLIRSRSISVSSKQSTSLSARLISNLSWFLELKKLLESYTKLIRTLISHFIDLLNGNKDSLTLVKLPAAPIAIVIIIISSLYYNFDFHFLFIKHFIF